MEINLTKIEQAKLRQKHRESKTKFEADRIKCILYLNDGETEEEICQLLFIGKSTIYYWLKEFNDNGIDKYLTDNRGGSEGNLSDEQTTIIYNWIVENHPGLANEVIVEIREQFGIEYSEEGIRKVLHRMGFVCKKSKIIPKHPEPEVQEEFIKEYQENRNNLGKNDQIYFIDAAHLIFNTEPGFAWVLKGTILKFPAQTGRKRINELAAYSPITKDALVIENDTTCNAETVIELFEKMKEENSKAKIIHVYLDNVRYQHAKIVKEFVKEEKIILHYLPPYSPNLNLIERLWRLLRKKVKRNKYYKSFEDFLEAIHQFFNDIKFDKSEIETLMVENFEIIR